MEIKPTYVSFEQAKLLKEKGFNVRLKKVYNVLGELWDSHYQYMVNSNPDCGAAFVAPEQWVVVEWALLVHNIDIEARPVRYAGDKSTSYYQPYINGCIVNLLCIS